MGVGVNSDLWTSALGREEWSGSARGNFSAVPTVSAVLLQSNDTIGATRPNRRCGFYEDVLGGEVRKRKGTFALWK